MEAKGNRSSGNDRLMHRMEFDRKRALFFEERSEGLTFTYYVDPTELVFSERAAAEFGVDDRILRPTHAKAVLDLAGEEQLSRILQLSKRSSVESPTVEMPMTVNLGSQKKTYDLTIRFFWSDGDRSVLLGGVGTLEPVLPEGEKVKNATAAPSGQLLDMLQGQLTEEQAASAMRTAAMTYDTVRIVDPATLCQYRIGEDGKLKKQEKKCFATLECAEECPNCIARQVAQKRQRQAEFKFSPRDTYYVQALYTEVNNTPAVLELISRIDDETFLNASGQEKLIEAISAHNRRIYTDSLTGIYNRRYYDEVLSKMEGESAGVVMIDADHFKSVNDTFGHLAGDEALKAIASAISGCIRSKDALVRYGGDEFLLVLWNMPEAVLQPKLEMIRDRVAQTVLPEFPELKLGVSMGGVLGNGAVADLIAPADSMLYKAKKSRNCVVTGKADNAG